MVCGESSQRIVQVLPGPGTGDIRYMTEDGRWWETYRGGHVGTGEALGTVSGGRMHPKPLPPPAPREPEPPRPNRAERRAAESPRRRKGMRGDR